MPAPFCQFLTRGLLVGCLSLGGFTFVAPTWAATQVEPATAYWVYFRDHGSQQPQHYAARLQARQAELSARTLARRAKVRPPGQLVDESDLLPDESYVQSVRATGVEMRKTSRWLNAISVKATAQQAALLRTLPGVKSVEKIAVYRQRPPVPWAVPEEPAFSPAPPRAAIDYGQAAEQLMLLNAPMAHECGLTGKGVVVGILDSGFQVNHPALKDVEVLGAHDFVHDDDEVANESEDPSGQHDHGTACLSLIAAWDPGSYVGGAYGVSVVLAKTEDTAQEDMTEEDNYVAGLEWVEEQGADIATSSLGYSDWWQPADFNGMTAPTSKAVGAAVERGLICLTATGNSGPEEKTLGVPADAFGVLSIGAVSLSGSLASFSSRGPTADGRMKPEFVAPGSGVYVADAGGGYKSGSGTSYATPLAAAMVALLLESDAKLTPADILETFKASATLDGDPGNDYGFGLINIGKATEVFCTCADADKDGFRDHTCGGVDCDDSDAAINPDAEEICTGGVDENCDDKVDEEDPACGGDDTTSTPDSDETSTGDTSQTTEDDPSDEETSTSDDDDTDDDDDDDDDDGDTEDSDDDTGDDDDDDDGDDDDDDDDDDNAEDDEVGPTGCGCTTALDSWSSPFFGLACLGLATLRRRRRPTAN